jgi:hypothetical protein
LTTGMTLQMVQLNTLGQLERGHLERGVINVAPFFTIPVYGSIFWKTLIFNQCCGSGFTRSTFF